jgi:DNA-directed RNA polymerase specialized sigma24 family protein
VKCKSVEAQRSAEMPCAEMTEAEALRRARNGETSGFEQLYRLHSGRVYALCLRMAGSHFTAQRLTRETFLQMFRMLQTFRGELSFSARLHRLAILTVLKEFRKEGSFPIPLSEPDNMPADRNFPIELESC